MKRICLFAGYDSKNIIHDYVVNYIKELSSLFDVYYMADNEISDHEKSKIASYVKGAYGFKHSKYDFGSWQELIKIIGWEKISEYDELLLTNDSIIGPLYPLNNLFNKIEDDKDWQAFGLVEECLIWNDNGIQRKNNYLQSYFILLKKDVFLEDFFKDFFENIKVYDNKNDVIMHGEIGLSAELIKHNKVCKKLIYGKLDPFKMWKTAIFKKMPFIKKAKFVEKVYYEREQSIYKYEDFFKKYTSYNVELLTNYMKAKNIDFKYINSLKYRAKNIVQNINEFRQNLFKINIKKYKKQVILFGIPFINKDYRTLIFDIIGRSNEK